MSQFGFETRTEPTVRSAVYRELDARNFANPVSLERFSVVFLIYLGKLRRPNNISSPDTARGLFSVTGTSRVWSRYSRTKGAYSVSCSPPKHNLNLVATKCSRTLLTRHSRAASVSSRVSIQPGQKHRIVFTRLPELDAFSSDTQRAPATGL